MKKREQMREWIRLRLPIWRGYDEDQFEEREIREIVSEYRAKNIIYLPIKNAYVFIDDLAVHSQDVIEQYIHREMKHWMSLYFRTLLPLKNYTKNQRLQKLMGNLLELLQEEVTESEAEERAKK